MAQIKCTQIALTANKKIIILSVYSYLQKNMLKQQTNEATNLRKEVSLVTGVGEATIARVVAEFNETGKVKVVFLFPLEPLS
ncbi:27814_t:CDS:2 [Dentiscutata erythropus]|uniref:27814_t:CDS:1 n=1 Tax=Dentiscutata erythropus TaxID=1348616 RepID=A0A9N9HDC9_9GLOM|nr:27814_t:CDS:2 [Dentiscutata erythropus]